MPTPSSKPPLAARLRLAAGLIARPAAVADSFRNAVRSRLRPGGGRAPIATATAHRDQRTLDTLIADCAALARNNHLVRSVLAARADMVVGHAPTIEVTSADEAWNRSVEARFFDWSESRADVFGQLGFWDLARDITAACESEGGKIVHRVDRGGELALELIEVIRLRNPQGTLDDERFKGGVELENFRPVRYHLAEWDKSGSYLQTFATKAIDAAHADLLNNPRLLAAGQWRAEPGLAPVVDRFETLDEATTAAFAAYVVAAGVALALMRDRAKTGGSLVEELAASAVGAGMAASATEAIQEGVWNKGILLELDQGDEVQQVKGEHPSTPFQEAFWMELQTLAAAVDLPLELTHYRYIRNFHASRSAIATAWRRIQAYQDWLRRRFVSPVYRAWLATEINAGRVAMREDWASHEVRLATMPVLDPKVETEAVLAKIAGGVMLHEQGLAELGVFDRAAFMRKRAKELEEERAIGLTAGAMPVQKSETKTEEGDRESGSRDRGSGIGDQG